MTHRIGFGYDAHRFGAERPLVLGGVTVEHHTGLHGHSDADAIAHAVIDALLGATGLGDIGRLYPDTDERWKNADSMRLLHDVRGKVADAGYHINNVDVTVVTEAPKLAPYTGAVRENLARVLEVSPGSVSVKAKTNEKMDAVGQGTGLTVYAIASIGESRPD